MITYESIFSKKNIQHAFEHLSIKKNGAGTDTSSLGDLKEYWELNRERILEGVRTCSFKPDMVQEYEIINGRGKRRTVTKYSEPDKLITRLIAQKLNEYFTPIFESESHAYQENKGITTAVESAKRYVENKKEFVTEIDVRNFFDEIDLGVLLSLLKEHITDKRVLALIESYLYCTVISDGDIYKKEKGLVQGCSMSPVLSNVYLHKFDIYMSEEGYNWIRFADNICVYTGSEDEGIDIFNDLKDLLKSEYLLEINESKSGVFDVFDRRLLGFDLYKRGNRIKVERHTYNRDSYYRNWHESAVEKVNREYHIINSGVLNKKDYAMLFENEELKHHIPVEATEQLNVYNEITLTSAVIRTLDYEGIRLGIYDKYGDLLGYFIPESYNQDAKVLLAQAKEYNDDKRRLRVAKAMEMAAMHNIRANVRYFEKHKSCSEIKEIEQILTDAIVKMNQCKSVEELLLEEARCRQKYYQGFNLFLKNDYFVFEKRTRRPPMDPINALISFGNTLLYNRIQQIIWKTSLDTRIGIFHSANNRHCSLNLDFADLFKPIIVDRVIFTLINKGQIGENDFTTHDNGTVYLNEKGKRLFIESFNNKMASKLNIKGKSMTYHQLIESELRTYLHHILTEEKYKPYKYY